mmetsp:Transcript_9131/g.23019  ORF Transcript_9131/g.23019 Transcript_9131/m.23019 type:complete len:323 (-) Transcript_9131:4-972(-)
MTAASTFNISSTATTTWSYMCSSALCLFWASWSFQFMSSNGNMPIKQPTVMPKSCPKRSHRFVDAKACCALDSGGASNPALAAMSSTTPPEKTPKPSESVFPSAAAAMVEKPKVAHKVRSIMSPKTIITALSRMPNPKNGSAEAMHTCFSCTVVGGQISAFSASLQIASMRRSIAASRCKLRAKLVAKAGSSSMSLEMRNINSVCSSDAPSAAQVCCCCCCCTCRFASTSASPTSEPDDTCNLRCSLSAHKASAVHGPWAPAEMGHSAANEENLLERLGDTVGKTVLRHLGATCREIATVARRIIVVSPIGGGPQSQTNTRA